MGGNPPFLKQAEFDDGGPYQNRLQQRAAVILLPKTQSAVTGHAHDKWRFMSISDQLNFV